MKNNIEKISEDIYFIKALKNILVYLKDGFIQRKIRRKRTNS
tara:strand:+ start:1093 stop:1218 length:126 start_codon:yes stop_codon:yes gene_type:complete